MGGVDRLLKRLSIFCIDTDAAKYGLPTFGKSSISALSSLSSGPKAPSDCVDSTSDESDVDDKAESTAIKVDQQKGSLKGRDPSKSDGEDEQGGRWSSQLLWLNSILESALKLYRRTVPLGDFGKGEGLASTRSLVDIASNLHRSTTTGMQNWSLGDLTFGLYLLSLRHASEMALDSIKGEQVLSDCIVKDFIYHVELAKGAYMKNAASLARISMLRESNVIKFIDKASVMRPAYYIGVDTRHKLVVLGIRGTGSVHDLITDLVSHSQEEVTFDGGSVHFGTFEAAHWFLRHELDAIRSCLEQNMGFGLRLVGHSLGGATASLLAMMLRRKSKHELGFCPSIISAVGIATPPCASRTLAIKSADFIRTVVLQDDVIPRMSAASLIRLRNEILMIDWGSLKLKEGEEGKGVLDLIASTVQALSSVQDVACRYAAYGGVLGTSLEPERKSDSLNKLCREEKNDPLVPEKSAKPVEELFAPGALFHIRGPPCLKIDSQRATETREGYILLRGKSNEFFSRVVLSRTMLSDHKCDSYYHGLRDVLKGIQLVEEK